MKWFVEIFFFFWQIIQNLIGMICFVVISTKSKRIMTRNCDRIILWVYDKTLPQWLTTVWIGKWIGVEYKKYKRKGAALDLIANETVEQILWTNWGHYTSSWLLGPFYVPLCLLQSLFFWIPPRKRFMERFAVYLNGKMQRKFELKFGV